MSWLSAGMADVPRGDDWLDGALAGRLRAMRHTARRREARLRYWVVKSALAHVLDVDAGDPAAMNRIVSWDTPDGRSEAFVDGEPAGVGLALSVRADWGVCAVGAAGIRVGCNLDVVGSGAASASDHLTPAERTIVASAAGDGQLVAGLIVSAKESACRVLRSRGRPDLGVLEVDLADDVRATWGRFTVRGPAGGTSHGWWRRFDRFILTITGDTPMLPPRSLVVPPALADAVPNGSRLSLSAI